MKTPLYLLLPAWAICLHVSAQTLPTLCETQATMSVSICLDPPGCLIYTPQIQAGTPPYDFLWHDGSTGVNLVYTGPNIPANPCPVVTVTDFNGCVLVLSAVVWNSAAGLPDFLKPDSIFPNGAPYNFDLHLNDHPLAQEYLLVQAPAHGSVSLQPDGKGVYTPESGWCGPDYFRYTAQDTSSCGHGNTVNVSIFNGPCAQIFATRSDCSGACGGVAVFYQQGLLTAPLSFAWSNGDTSDTASGLCAGPVSLTVTDAGGNTTVYSADIPLAGIETVISGPLQICEYDQSALTPQVSSTTPGAVLSYEWSGPGVYASLKYQEVLNLYAGGNDTLSYQLIVRASDGCTDTTWHHIHAFPRPTADQPKYNTPLYAGDTLEIKIYVQNGTPPYSYTWVGPMGIQSNYTDLFWPDISPFADGLYRVSVTDANGCQVSRNVSVLVKDALDFSIKAYLGSNQPACKGSDVTLWFGATAWPVPIDKVVWTGPSGFYAEDYSPVIQDVQPGMAGFYKVQVYFGDVVLTDSVQLVVSDYSSSIVDYTAEAPTECLAPYDGKLTVTMSSPPPYVVSFTWGGSAVTYNTNPIVYNSALYGEWDINIQTNGCVVTGSVNIPYPNAPTWNIVHESCAGNDGAISIQSPDSLKVGWSGPGNFLAQGIHIDNLVPGIYKFGISDITTKCNFNGNTAEVLPYLQFDVTTIDTPTCYSTDGALQAIALGQATQPVSYSWNNGFTGNPNTGLGWGGYSVTMTDGAGCHKHKNVVLPPEHPCVGLVTGHVYFNTDCVCLADSNDYPLPQTRVCITKGSYKDCVYTDNTGYYELAFTEPGTYTLQAFHNNNYLQDACASQTITLDSIEQAPDVPLFKCGPAVQDLGLSISCWGATRPGFEQLTYLHVSNAGTLPFNDTALVQMQISPFLEADHFSPAPFFFDPSTGIVVWKLTKLAINGTMDLRVYSTVTGFIGDTVWNTASITLPGTDADMSNNSDFCERVITGSFDPNDKLVNPLGAGAGGQISPADTLLTYTIRFQNTGNDTAFTVVIRDTLDRAVFDLNSVRPLMSSHPFRLDVEGDHILVFTFSPIALPDSARSYLGSQGFVKFGIRLLSGLTDGAAVRNQAAIYFDYNAPVITNNTLNTVTGTAEPAHNVRQPRLTVQPNPTPGRLDLTLMAEQPLQQVWVRILEPTGRLMFNQPMAETGGTGRWTWSMDLSNYPSGVYIIQVQTDQGTATRKIVVAH